MKNPLPSKKVVAGPTMDSGGFVGLKWVQYICLRQSPDTLKQLLVVAKYIELL
jgi:hypothetical protein